jgi:hypothetical protein
MSYGTRPAANAVAQIKEAPSELVSMNIGNGGLQISNAKQMWDMAGVISNSAFKPKGLTAQEDIFLGIQFGYGIGLSDPLQIIQNIAVVNGRPSFYGDMLVGICKASELFQDHYEEVKYEKDREGKDDLVCLCYAHRKGESKPHVGKFSFRDAQRAGLTSKDTYKGYPQDMLMWKARARAFRAAFPDVLKGVSFREDMDERPERTTIEADVENAPKRGLAGIVAKAKQTEEPVQMPEETHEDTPESTFPTTNNTMDWDEPQIDSEPFYEPEVVDVEIVEEEPEFNQQAALCEEFQRICRVKGMRVPAMLAVLNEFGHEGKIGDASVDVLSQAIEKMSK